MKRIGWTDRDDLILKSCVADAEHEGRSLSSAFRSAARLTGRMPDSIRNHYYAEKNGSKGRTYKPFTDEETARLIKEITDMRAKGYSVRRAALELAGGDAALMLRYQNKYRAESGKIPPKKPVKKDADPSRLIREKNRELSLQHKRFMMLHAMFTKLCELNSELAKQLADEDKIALFEKRIKGIREAEV
ncbi:MAG: hypothetical protein J5854_06860 [Clostridia bacterium]|nr:hypothetical protein [Clostridia bacterium]